MAKHDGETIIKKYANRRLYNTGTSTYVTLDDLAQMVKRGEDFKVQDAKSSEDITHAVLTQIIVEQEAKTGNTLLPTAFLRQLISYYGDQMQMVVPTFLEHSMKTFSDQQSQMQEHMAKAFGDGSLARNFQAPLQMMEEQIRRNTELFRQAMQGFTPFAMPQAPKETRKPNASEIDELKSQLRAHCSKNSISSEGGWSISGETPQMLSPVLQFAVRSGTRSNRTNPNPRNTMRVAIPICAEPLR